MQRAFMDAGLRHQSLVLEVAEAVVPFKRVLCQAHRHSMPYDFSPLSTTHGYNDAVQKA
jgi:hypothetical protein